MGMPLLDEAQSILRRNRAVLAASAAAAIVIGGSCYAVYRLQSVLEGMQQNNQTTSGLCENANDSWQPAR